MLFDIRTKNFQFVFVVGKVYVPELDVVVKNHIAIRVGSRVWSNSNGYRRLWA